MCRVLRNLHISLRVIGWTIMIFCLNLAWNTPAFGLHTSYFFSGNSKLITVYLSFIGILVSFITEKIALESHGHVLYEVHWQLCEKKCTLFLMVFQVLYYKFHICKPFCTSRQAMFIISFIPFVGQRFAYQVKYKEKRRECYWKVAWN